MSKAKPPPGIDPWPHAQYALEYLKLVSCDLCEAAFTDDDVQVHVRVNAHTPRTILVHVECCDIVSRYAGILLS